MNDRIKMTTAAKMQGILEFMRCLNEEVGEEEWDEEEAKGLILQTLKKDKPQSRITEDEYFIGIAEAVAKRSHDIETQVGCVLVKDNRIISTGFNGFLSGADDEALPNTRPEKYPFMIHAEANAVYACAKFGIAAEGATAYVTLSPCPKCTQLLWQAGIREIVFSKLHSSFEDTKALKDVKVKHIPASNRNTYHHVALLRGDGGALWLG